MRLPERLEYRAKLFRGLSDRSRLAILEALRRGPRTVTEIVAATGLSQSNTSNHLRCLSECGLVVAGADGRFVRYRLSAPSVARMFMMADDLLAGVAKRILACTNYNAGDSAPVSQGEALDMPRRATKRAGARQGSG